MRRNLGNTGLILVFCAHATLALAQQPQSPQINPADIQAARQAAQQAREAAEIRVETTMVTMSSLVEAMARNLGQMHYLRTLCFGNDDQKWRRHAGQMLNLEAPDDKVRRKELIRAFNTGYYQEEGRHAECSQAVSIDAAALAENGRHLASMLGDPYREP